VKVSMQAALSFLTVLSALMLYGCARQETGTAYGLSESEKHEDGQEELGEIEALYDEAAWVYIAQLSEESKVNPFVSTYTITQAETLKGDQPVPESVPLTSGLAQGRYALFYMAGHGTYDTVTAVDVETPACQAWLKERRNSE